jgi:hypothetical protein
MPKMLKGNMIRAVGRAGVSKLLGLSELDCYDEAARLIDVVRSSSCL